MGRATGACGYPRGLLCLANLAITLFHTCRVSVSLRRECTLSPAELNNGQDAHITFPDPALCCTQAVQTRLPSARNVGKLPAVGKTGKEALLKRHHPSQIRHGGHVKEAINKRMWHCAQLLPLLKKKTIFPTATLATDINQISHQASICPWTYQQSPVLLLSLLPCNPTTVPAINVCPLEKPNVKICVLHSSLPTATYKTTFRKGLHPVNAFLRELCSEYISPFTIYSSFNNFKGQTFIAVTA